MCTCVTDKQTEFLPKLPAFCWILTKNNFFFHFAPLLLLFLFSSSTLAQRAQHEEVLVALRVKHIGSIELSSVINDNQEIYLSIPEVLDFLKIKNSHTDNYSVIDGFFINQNNIFHIDATTHIIRYKGEYTQLQSDDFVHTTTNLYLKASYFNSIFELENTFSFRGLSVSMSSKLELPAVRAARLKLMRDNINSLKYNFVADTTFTRDKPLFHFGAADWTLNTIQQTNGMQYQNLLVSLGGMVAGGEFVGSLNYGNNRPVLLRNQYYRWRYVNNDNRYVTQISAGKIAAPIIATVFNPIIGVQITNATTTTRKSFGTYVLSDYTKPDWTVELYINNVLVDYLKADANGFYSFNVPLMYGRTEVSVRYYGPWGEEEVSNKQFVIPYYFLPKNKLEYSLSSGIIEDHKKSPFVYAKANYGLSDYITLEGGIEYVSSIEKNKIIPYFGTSIRLANQLFISGGYFSKVKYAGNLNFSSPKNVRLDLDYTKYEKDQEAVLFNFSEIRRASLNIPIHTSHFLGTTRLTFQQNLSPTSVYTISELVFSGMAYGMNFNFTTNSYSANNSSPFVFSDLSTSLRLPKGIVLIPNIRYEYGTAKITLLRTELKKQVFKKGFVQASFDRDFKYDNSSFQIGFQYNFKFASAGFSSNIDRNLATFSQSVNGSLIFEPNADFMDFNNRSSIGKGSIKFVPFLDINGNGKRDMEEQGIQGLQVILNGGIKALNATEGTTIITGLEPYVKNFITFDTAKINNIAWQLKNKTLNITLNPNQLRTIEIPILVVGEVAGMVQRSENGQLIGTSGLKINIYKNNTVFITSVLSEPDGYFGYLGLPSGQYSAKIDPVQLQTLQLRAESKNTNFIIKNGSDGDIIDNLEFILYKD